MCIRMNRFVPEDKMSKKAKKALARSRRVTWDVSPVSKKVESKKLYNRSSKQSRAAMEDGAGFLFAFGK